MLRIAVVTPVFPNSNDPYRGIFNYHRVRALQKWADVDVNVLLPAYPRAKIFQPVTRSYPRIDPSYTVPGVKVRYIEYPVLPVISRPFNSSTCARRLLPYMEKDRPDLILAYWVYPEGMGAVIVGKKLGIPVVVQAVGTDLRVIPDRLTRMGVKRTLRRAGMVLTVSEELREQAIALGAPPTRVRKVLNGCDASIFHLADRAAARAELGIGSDTQLVVFVGRLTSQKGILELFEAVGRLAPSHPRLRLACIGEDVLGEAGRALAANPELQERVQMLGRRTPTEVARWYAAANLLCLPSYSEGCPNVLIEALCCGRPAVASNIGGIPELVDASCAILVPPKDAARLAEGLTQALERVWDEKAIAARSGRTWDDVGRETFEACRTLLQAK